MFEMFSKNDQYELVQLSINTSTNEYHIRTKNNKMLHKSIFAIAIYSTFASDPAPNYDANQVITCEEGEPCWGYFSAAIEVAEKQPRARNSGPSDPNKLILRDFRREFILPMARNGSLGVGPTVGEGNKSMQSRSSSSAFSKYLDLRWDSHITHEYGCWCHTAWGSQNVDILWPPVAAGSQPVDEWDNLCKIHAINMKCIVIDSEYDDRECDPYSTDYDATFTRTIERDADGNWLKQMTTFECTQTLEDDWCKKRVCLTDLALISANKILQAKDLKPVKNIDYYHSKGFDFINQCNNFNDGHGGTDTTGLKCCGDYPHRTFYDPLDNENQCCVYSVLTDDVNRYYGSIEKDLDDRNLFNINIGQIYDPEEKYCNDYGLHDRN